MLNGDKSHPVVREMAARISDEEWMMRDSDPQRSRGPNENNWSQIWTAILICGMVILYILMKRSRGEI